MTKHVPPRLLEILRTTPGLDRSYLVGGCVRDWMLGVPGKDIDVEVYGLDYDRLVRALSRQGRADLVGRSFGVVKLTDRSGQVWDFSLPRRDSKAGIGHRGFTVEFSPDLGTAEASARRDFTVNSLMWDPRREEMLDHHGGAADLRGRVLRHTSPAFVEDPLRVLRGMQFCARFQLTAAPETLALCRSIAATFPELPVERVRDEWFKWAARSTRPEFGLRFLRDSGWLVHFPELDALPGVPQDPVWHPEGDVWIHTGHCLEALVDSVDWKSSEEEGRIVLSLAVLLHDIGKPQCTREEPREGRTRIVSPGHESVGGTLAAGFLERVGVPVAIRDRVVPLVANHMVHADEPTPRMVRRLAGRLAPSTIEDLCRVMTADASGRPPRPRGIPAGVSALREAARNLHLESSAPKPLLLGRHLMSRGVPPGREMGQILREAFEAQLDGAFQDVEGALGWLDRR
jgi:tRNA nucleotidyltransferase (CCA-adding enzyme)